MYQKRIENLDWFPDPVFNTNGSEYLPFNEVFGKPTTDAARPSLKEKQVLTESDKQNKSVLVAGIYEYCTYWCNWCIKFTVDSVKFTIP